MYDEEYIDYVIEVLRKCREHGLLVFMDPHQDVVRFIYPITLNGSGLDSREDRAPLCGH